MPGRAIERVRLGGPDQIAGRLRQQSNKIWLADFDCRECPHQREGVLVADEKVPRGGRESLNAGAARGWPGPQLAGSKGQIRQI